MKTTHNPSSDSMVIESSRLLMIVVQITVALAFFFLAFAANAQEVYNFYFQKAPGATSPTINTTTGLPSVTTATDANDSVVTNTNAASPLPSVSLEESAAEGTSKTVAQPKTSSDVDRRWSVQLMRSIVADAYSDAYYDTRDRVGIQLGYRVNKYVGAEIGAAFGTIEGNWSAITATDAFRSVVPYLGIRANPLHLNVFGSEFLEIFAVGGAILIDRGWADRNDDNRQTYCYLGGGFRMNITSHIGFEMHARTIAGDTRYGVGGMGVDVRF